MAQMRLRRWARVTGKLDDVFCTLGRARPRYAVFDFFIGKEDVNTVPANFKAAGHPLDLVSVDRRTHVVGDFGHGVTSCPTELSRWVRHLLLNTGYAPVCKHMYRVYNAYRDQGTTRRIWSVPDITPACQDIFS